MSSSSPGTWLSDGLRGRRGQVGLLRIALVDVHLDEALVRTLALGQRAQLVFLKVDFTMTSIVSTRKTLFFMTSSTTPTSFGCVATTLEAAFFGPGRRRRAVHRLLGGRQTAFGP